MAAIYHIAYRRELAPWGPAQRYRPALLQSEGFVHAAATLAVAVAVANDYFDSHNGDVWIVRIDPERLDVPLKYEAAAPRKIGGRDHLALANRWPHIYGEIVFTAVTAAAPLPIRDDRFTAPETWLEPGAWQTA